MSTEDQVNVCRYICQILNCLQLHTFRGAGGWGQGAGGWELGAGGWGWGQGLGVGAGGWGPGAGGWGLGAGGRGLGAGGRGWGQGNHWVPGAVSQKTSLSGFFYLSDFKQKVGTPP